MAYAKDHVVNDDISLDSANAFLLDIKRVRKEINKAYDPIIKKTHEAHKEAIGIKRNRKASYSC